MIQILSSIMQTNNLSMQMLLQNQSSPDITINENLLKIDSFIFGTAVDITDSIPAIPQNGEVYIFSSKFEKPNQIGLFISNKGWKFFEPKVGLEFFVASHQCKYSFTSQGWHIATGSQQNADWNATSGVSQILNKPSLFSGSYSDLTNKPTLFDGSYTSLTNKPIIPTLPTLATVATSGSYNDLTNKPTIPTSLDSSYIGDFKRSLQSVNHGKWLLCNGQAVSRSTYSALFTIIGIAFGVGDGSTTFTLPDCRGRVNASIGQGVGLTNRTLGQVVGTETHTLSIGEMPSHNHIDGFAGVNNAASFGVSPALTVAGNINSQSGQTAVNHPFTSSSGGGEAHNNMQPTIFLGNTFIYAGV